MSDEEVAITVAPAAAASWGQGQISLSEAYWCVGIAYLDDERAHTSSTLRDNGAPFLERRWTAEQCIDRRTCRTAQRRRLHERQVVGEGYQAAISLTENQSVTTTSRHFPPATLGYSQRQRTPSKYHPTPPTQWTPPHHTAAPAHQPTYSN